MKEEKKIFIRSIGVDANNRHHILEMELDYLKSSIKYYEGEKINLCYMF